MASRKKFGAFGGVFTPSILTILGVIMYMRLGWVVGNAGLIGTIAIILFAHLIAVTTGLSVSSVATDKKIGAGGIYYVLSRSMGIPIGGSIGIALSVGTAFSIALYLVGFAESFNAYLGLGTTINDLRISGTVALVVLSAIALVSTSAAIKTQFLILAAIIISLISIFFGTTEFAPETVSMFTTEGSVPLEIVFAIFFPAVTGFTAGIAMSGDLKDPKKSIPFGTLSAIGVGLIVYIGLAVFLSYNVSSDVLREDYNILMKIALFAPAVVAGIWGATLSSALGGILGGPRILQAMSLDRVTPGLFGRGRGKNKEPVNALILVFIIAEAGVLIGELDVIARVVSMFYLTAYGFINISYFLESWANPDFQPTFKIKRWIGLVGFIACFGVMFKLDVLAMFGAFAVVAALYVWLQRRQIQLQSNDVWQSVWSNVVNKGLKKLESKDSNNANWNPNIILFSGDTPNRSKLLEFGRTVSGRTGVVTDFKLVVNDGVTSMSKNKQAFKDEILDRLGIYGRKIEVVDAYSGVENIASTYGFTGIEPNTVMMNWSRTTDDPVKYARMTEKLIHLDYNLLYLDYDVRTHFGKYRTIDLWWREADSKNAEMMLNISRFITQSPEWSRATVRILFVNYHNTDDTVIKSKIARLIGQLRVDAEIKIINNGVEQKSFYKIIELQSAKTDLIVLGIPNIKADKQAQFILNTEHLFETVGTTLLVKASNNFNALDLDFVQKEQITSMNVTELEALGVTEYEEINDVVFKLDSHLSETARHLAEPAFSSLSTHYYQFVSRAKKKLESTIQSLDKSHSVNRVAREIQGLMKYYISSSDEFQIDKIPEIEVLLKLGIESFVKDRLAYLQDMPNKLSYLPNGAKPSVLFSNKRTIKWKAIVDSNYTLKIFPNVEKSFNELGVQNFILLNILTEGIKEEAQLLIERMGKGVEESEKALAEFNANTTNLFDELLGKCALLEAEFVNKISTYERFVCNELINKIENKAYYKDLSRERNGLSRRAIKQSESNIIEFASNWAKNQSLAHNQMQADLALANAGLSVFMKNELIKSRIGRISIKPQRSDLKLLTDAVRYIGDHFSSEELDHYTNSTIDKLARGIQPNDFNDILKNEEDRILAISGKAPKLVQLISSEAFNELMNCQNDDVEEIEVSLASIMNYIIQSTYLAPLQDTLRGLESVLKDNAVVLYNAANLLKHILSEPLTEESRDVYKKSLSQMKHEVSDSLSKLQDTETSFHYDLSIYMHNTLTGLNIQTIMVSIDSYSKVSHKPIIKTDFQSWFDARKEYIGKQYDKIFDFIVQRRRDVDSITFSEKHNKYLNAIELTTNFVDHISLSDELNNVLPFYYKRLFTGSHLGNVNPVYRQKELDAVKNAIDRIDGGVSGAIMVLAESSAGKTYFVESVANTLMKGEKIYIRPPVEQSYTLNDVDSAFEDAFSSSGTAETILSQTGQKCILIIDDLENWWVKSPEGTQAIDYLSKIVERFGQKHCFILACNLFSYDIIRQLSNIDEQLLVSVVVPPVNKMELREVIMTRHKTTGVEILYKENPIQENLKADALFNTLYHKSKGNLGVALSMWLNSIELDEKRQLMMTETDAFVFPQIVNPKWKVLLYHLILHGGLSEVKIGKIFRNENWVLTGLNELLKTGLVHKQPNNVYEVSYISKRYVEEWLKERGVLN